MRYLVAVVLWLILAATAMAGEFSIISAAYKDQGEIPVLYTCDGDNISPPLDWSGAPDNTQSYVLIFKGIKWINSDVYLWVLYNIPKSVKGLDEDIYQLPKGTLVGTNFYDQNKYRGPCPPDTRKHEYVYTLYALDTVLYPIDDDIDPDKLVRIMKPHILKQTTLTGFYNH